MGLRSFHSYFSSYLLFNRTHRTAVKMIQATALAMVLAIPLQAGASGEREILSRVKPVCPEVAKRMKISGSVLLHVTVEPDGRVKEVTTVLGNTMLAEAAKEAVLHWKYAPADYETIEDAEVVF